MLPKLEFDFLTFYFSCYLSGSCMEPQILCYTFYKISSLRLKKLPALIFSRDFSQTKLFRALHAWSFHVLFSTSLFPISTQPCGLSPLFFVPSSTQSLGCLVPQFRYSGWEKDQRRFHFNFL